MWRIADHRVDRWCLRMRVLASSIGLADAGDDAELRGAGHGARARDAKLTGG